MLPDEEPPTPPTAGSDYSTGDAPLTLGLSPARVQELRAALGAHARGQRPPSAALQALLREASDAARMRGLAAERLLVDFKLLWYALPEVRVLRPAQQQELLGELVTHCIRAYYGEDA